MMGFVKSNDPQTPPDGIKQAAEVLQYLSAAGNKAAEQRLSDLKQFCYHVWSPDLLLDDWKWLGVKQASDVSDPLTTVMNPMTTFSDSGIGNHPHRSGENAPLYQSTWPENWGVCYDGMTGMPTTETGQRSAMLDFDFEETFGVDLTNGAGDIYSSFNDPDLPLTGVDEVDWAEIGKMFRDQDAQ
ncbi:hypothetical protein QQX98_011679 [Neonectria punicea]|uniref:Uncharacterized protein n=1 Tax=Neonectria punicea TaxID=979145 RepID=A0ABR1GLE8_9HYPO